MRCHAEIAVQFSQLSETVLMVAGKRRRVRAVELVQLRRVLLGIGRAKGLAQVSW